MESVFGSRLPFEEVDNRWVRHRYFRQVRDYGHPLLRRSVYWAELAPAGEGVRPTAGMELESSALASPVVATALRRIQRRIQAHFAGLPAPGEARPLVRRDLTSSIREGLSRFRERVGADLADRLEVHLRTARPLELQQMRAYVLADRWGLDRKEVLIGLIHGVPAGLLELYWSVRCPRCHGQTAATVSLGVLADHATCTSCRIGFGADLGEHVEVLFAPHPALGGRVTESFCSIFPLGAPDTWGSWILQPGERIEEALTLRPGVYRLGPGGEEPDLQVIVAADAPDRAIWWAPGGGGEVKVQPGAVSLILEAARRARITLTRHGHEQDRVVASTLATLPVFRRELSHQVLAPELRISTRSVSLLFTDLSGSTAMYEELGDARAFAVVRDHFALLRRVVEAHQGVVVKTIGDAVMAAFDAPVQAVEAGLEMSEAMDAWTATLGLAHPPRLRIGVHTGPALMVHTEASGLDSFGRTVNLAARTEGVAGPGELALTEAVYAWSSVQECLGRRELEPIPVDVALKGLAVTRLYRVVPRALAASSNGQTSAVTRR